MTRLMVAVAMLVACVDEPTGRDAHVQATCGAEAAGYHVACELACAAPPEDTEHGTSCYATNPKEDGRRNCGTGWIFAYDGVRGCCLGAQYGNKAGDSELRFYRCE